MNRAIRVGLAASALLLLAAGLATSAVSIRPGEVVVVRRLGRLLPTPWEPGLHWALPFGMDRREAVRIDEVRRLEVGLAGVAGPSDEPGSGEFLAGDLNLAALRAVVQYRVDEPAAFVLNSGDPEGVLRRLAEASLARAISRRGINAILREDRAAIAREAREALGRSARAAGLGVAVLGIGLTDVRPPVEVQPAFDDAQAARSERDRRTHQARASAASAIARAKAGGDARLDRARTESARTVRAAEARASRFLALLAEADRDRALTVRRLYLDALRDLLPGIGRTLVLTGSEPLDLSVFGRE
jgi:membrane protease subunit HflK